MKHLHAKLRYENSTPYETKLGFAFQMIAILAVTRNAKPKCADTERVHKGSFERLA